MRAHGIGARHIACAALLLLASLAGCRSTSKALLGSSEPVFAAKVSDATWAQFRAADALVARGEDEAALARLEPIVAAHPLFVPAARLRQILLSGRGRGALLTTEAQALLERFPQRPEPQYLAIRLIPDLEIRYARIEAALRRFPRSWWLRYSYCWSLTRRRSVRAREPRFATELLKLARTPLPWAGSAILATQLRQAGQSRAVYKAILEGLVDKWPESKPHVRLALFANGDDRWEHVVAGLSAAPYAAITTSVLRSVGRDQLQARRLVQWLARDPELTARLIDAGHALRLIRAAEVSTDTAFADAVRTRAIAARRASGLGRVGRWYFGPRGVLRERAVRRGDLEAAIASFEESLPRVVRDDERNAFAPRLRAVLDGPGRGVRACPARGERAAEILRALLGIGWVEEVRILGRQWLAKHEGLASIVEEAERFARFELGVVELSMLGGTKRRLSDVLGEIRALARSIYGTDVLGESEVLSFPIIGGRIVDPFGPGLARFFDRYGRHLVMGTLDEPVTRPQLAFGRKVYERRLPVSTELAVPGRAREVIVEEMSFAATTNMGFSEPAGVALWNHYVLDLRKWEEWVDDLDAMWQRMRADPEAVLSDPLPRGQALSMQTPAQVHWRLLARAMRDNAWSREDLLPAVLELLRLHERAHLVDAQRFLPAMRNVGAALQLFSTAGFSPASLMAELEGRAEIAALASGADPLLTLAHLAGFSGDAFERDPSPHRIGFGRMLRELIARWRADGAPGAQDADRNLLAQLHLIDPMRARNYARSIIRDLGF